MHWEAPGGREKWWEGPAPKLLSHPSQAHQPACSAGSTSLPSSLRTSFYRIRGGQLKGSQRLFWGNGGTQRGRACPGFPNKPYAPSPERASLLLEHRSQCHVVACAGACSTVTELVLRLYILCQEELVMDSGVCLLFMRKHFWNIKITKVHTSHTTFHTASVWTLSKKKMLAAQSWPLWVQGQVQGTCGPWVGV